MKRIKLKPKKPNPLFELWLEEWRKEAASKRSDLQYPLSKALASLKKYPLPLKSGKDCIILQHFGKKLCLMLDRKLEEYKALNEGSIDPEDIVCLHCDYNEERASNKKHKSPEITKNIQRTELAVFEELDLSSWNLQKYAIVLILYKKAQKSGSPGFMNEVELLDEVEELCDHRSKVSITDLFDIGLISMRGAPIRYNLTEHGVNIAKKICEITDIDVNLINSSDLKKIQTCSKLLFTQKLNKNTESPNDRDINIETAEVCYENTQHSLSKFPQICKSPTVEFVDDERNTEQPDKSPVKQKSKENNTDIRKPQKKSKEVESCIKNHTDNLQRNIYLESNKFDIILLVDTQETCGVKTKSQHDATKRELSELNTLYEVRHLKVGDFAWIARCRTTKNELVLPYIVERKRIDDLCASITDGRFHEQKFRLKQSGIENLMYIIEEYDKGQRLTIPHSALMQASINTLIQDGFSVKYTKTHKDSMFYLSSLTRILNKVFKNKNLESCKKEALTQIDISNDTISLMEFKEFNKAASKQKMFKVSEMFIRQLLQLKGISIDKAFAIVECYPTPRTLFDAVQESDCNAESLLSSIQFGSKKRLIGAGISKTLYQLYTMKNLN
ncbi:crossover junction endonuclease MUS81 [Hylaeus anthracinus]|uniref:crossover junction endonuclease MUS81 n=1 Tax=Hylaeus anthracinus TaxID=313031 RepID=UPI0023B92208|nr:crossover junction endonuclease MUS81 [Hylaeus anthracinus]